MSLSNNTIISPKSGKFGWPWTKEVDNNIYSKEISYPKITIIVPSFNQGQYIEETILSVIRQNYPNLEFIIIDGGSTDESIDVIKKYNHFITHWVSEKDKGQSDAINKGLKITTGEVVNWLNSDDYFYPGTLEKIGRAFTDKNLNVYCGRNRLFSSANKINEQEQTIGFTNGTDIYNDNFYKTIACARIDQPCTFFRKRIYDELGGINQNLHFTMDKEFWIKYLFKYKINHIQKTENLLVNFRHHSNSKTVSLITKFEIETNTLFYALALKYKYQTTANIIKNNYELINHSIFSFSHNLSEDEVYKVLNYFIYQKVSEAYAINNFSLAKTLIDGIDKSTLNYTDIKELKKLQFRMRLPRFFKILYNKLMF